MTRPAAAAIALVSALFGSLLAWSVLVEPIQDTLLAARLPVTMPFALAGLCFASGWAAGDRFLPRYAIGDRLVGLCLIAALGLFLPGLMFRLPVLAVGYGVIFGLAAGAGLRLCQRAAAAAGSKSSASAIPSVFFAFTVGGALFAVLFDIAIAWRGPHRAILGCAILFAITAPVVQILLRSQPMTATAKQPENGPASPASKGRPIALWIACACAGLAVSVLLGQAAPIIVDRGGSTGMATIGVAGLCLLAASGYRLVGVVRDRLADRSVVAIAGAIALLGPVLGLTTASSAAALVLLLLLGLAAGAMAAGLTRLVPHHAGTADPVLLLASAAGAAAFVGPIFAGLAFDLTNGYTPVLIASLVSAVIAVLACLALPRAGGG